jgi:pimeloyl-ACP methyl ester carboxylesterase
MLSINTKRLLCLGLFISLMVGCGKSKSTPTVTPMPSPAPVAALVESQNFKFNDCPFQAPQGMPPEAMQSVQCASLTVPEDRKQPDGPKIQLAVAIVKSSSVAPKPDPLLMLFGNPGIGLDLAISLSYVFDTIYTQRDLIIIDQRGTGYSQPSFSCPEFNKVSYESVTQNLSVQETNDRYIEASRTCANRVKATNANLTAYTTAAVAADLEDLRLALGYKQWNIMAFYNGSRLALTMMRDYPQDIRSVIMDSVVPLQANPLAEWGVNVEIMFDRLFQHCTEDEQCNKAFPQLKSTFYALLAQLDVQQVRVDVADLNSGEQYKVMLDSQQLINFIITLFNYYDVSDALSEVPRMIYQLREGKTETVSRLMGSHPSFNTGNIGVLAMAQWVGCNEEYHFTTAEQIAKANENIDLYLQKFFNAQADGTARACEEWGAPGVPAIENQPVTSGIPSLLLAGELNWFTPPAWAEWTAQTLSNSTTVEFFGIGGMVYTSSLWSDCSNKIVDAFLETPTAKPDTSCASKPVKLLWVTLP